LIAAITLPGVSWDPFNPDWIASAANTNLAQVMIDTQHLIHIQLNNEQKWAKVVEIRDEGKLVKMRTENGETFIMKTEGQDTTSGYPTLREAIQRIHGYSAKTDPSGIHHARLNPSYPKREWNKVLLPRSKRGGQ